ncbi:MAG TPA: TonB-dependent receptor [Saprospiraceae bacterium]|nr:TonB-dependent receptor [Saprospiraceae bacterium]HMP23277.1 TonB-dependent receptor [Saprospiraceae bacterium]
MHKFYHACGLLCLLLGFPLSLTANNFIIRGVVQDAETQRPRPGAYVNLTDLGQQAITDARGNFILYDVPSGNYTLEIYSTNYVRVSLNVKVQDRDLDLGIIQILAQTDGTTSILEDFIPTISLSDEDLDQLTNNQNISGVLTASRDVFVSAAAFTFGPARFRIRGLDSENTSVFLNGIPVNKLENGRVFWNAWGGLNDVTRFRSVDVGLAAMPYAFGGIGGGTTIDTRASAFRKQLSVSYANSNRTFRNRVMATYSSGILDGGWAFVVSGSRRWADEGYIDGTFFDSWGYFLSVDKQLGKEHTLNITAFDAPLRRGRSTSSTQEMYDLAGSNFYNPLWGYQDGRKRNSSVAHADQPMIILRHDWKIQNKGTLTTALSYQFGTSGTTRLDWFDAPDPRPDYYRYLPSFLRQESDEAADFRQGEFMLDESRRQINWAALYDVNRNSLLDQKFDYLLGARRPEGERWSQYIIEDQRSDSRDANLYVNYQNVFSDKFTFHAGAGYQIQQVHEYKLIDDLLGGDYYLNVDRFAVRDSVANFNAQQNDLNNPSQILREGDVWGYNYAMNIHRWDMWAQGNLTLRRLDMFVAANVSGTNFWRTGYFRTGRFPDNSFGNAPSQDFLNYGLKGGMTYKLSGRHYLYTNAAYLTRAPFVETAYVSPRTRDQLYPNLTDQKIFSGEAGYYLRSPNVKGRATAYIAEFRDQIRILRFYNDLQRAFGNYVMSGLNQRHIGAELALDVKLVAGFNVTGVAALGEYVYTSRAVGNIYQDNTSDLGREARDFTIYSKNFRVAGMPQKAYTLGLNYRSPKFWFLNINFNYFDDIYIDFNPVRRTIDAVYNLDENADQFRRIIEQEKAPGQFTVDLFGGKSFKFGRKFLYLNLGVNNVLNNTDFITGGFEQLRFDIRERNPEAYPTRYFYNFGLNYFLNLSLRM